jgi:hypothetical protein
MMEVDVAFVRALLILSVGFIIYHMLAGMGQKHFAGLFRIAVIMAAVAVFVPPFIGYLLLMGEKFMAIIDRLEAVGNKVMFWR